MFAHDIGLFDFGVRQVLSHWNLVYVFIYFIILITYVVCLHFFEIINIFMAYWISVAPGYPLISFISQNFLESRLIHSFRSGAHRTSCLPMAAGGSRYSQILFT